MGDELKAVILSLLLPCDQREIDAHFLRFDEELAALELAEEDRALWLRAQIEAWKAGSPSSQFRKLIRTSIYWAGSPPFHSMFSLVAVDDPRALANERLANQYFEIHRALMKNHLMPHEQASQFISYAPMILALAIDQRMSASEISRVLASQNPEYGLDWAAVMLLLRKCKIPPSISLAQLESAFDSEAETELGLLGDMAMEEAVAFIGRLGNQLGQGQPFAHWLELLIFGKHEPYLVILHYQLSILRFYDHAVTYAYEFQPRGENGSFVSSKYRQVGLGVARNPFLNNAKALLRFDKAWAIGRPKHYEAAVALASLLNAIEQLGALPKAEMARYILALLHRKLRLSAEAGGPLPDAIPAFSDAQFEHLLASVAQNGGRTNGIIEQRLVDCLVLARHPRPQWAPRGLGDSVFAASLFRKKLGDVEVMRAHAENPQAIGYESHGGTLSPLYVGGHLTTFFSVLEKRLEELEAIAPIADWQLSVVFVAHALSGDLPGAHNQIVDGKQITVNISYFTFADLAQELGAHPQRQAILAHQFIGALNVAHVHRAVRQRVAQLAG